MADKKIFFYKLKYLGADENMKTEKNISKRKKTGIKENRIDKKFDFLKNNNQKALIPFITCGYPSVNDFMRVFSTLEKNGADIIEIGIPFSDPLADGPVIQETSRIALNNGVNTDIALDSVIKIRKTSEIPIVIMTYFNIVYRYGIDRFLDNALKAGVDGLIIPDLPLEEFYNYMSISDYAHMDNIMLASLTSDDIRLHKISSVCRGFLYCVSVKGVTGIRKEMSRDVKNFLTRLRSITDLPLALGFGISNPDQISGIKDYCDGVIIGSKILSIIMEADGIKEGLDDLGKFMKKINNVLK